MRSLGLEAPLTLVFWLTVVPAVHAAAYVFTHIDVPSASATTASAINNRGDIVGHFTDNSGTHGFVFDGKAFTAIDVPEAFGTRASAINNKGQIVGDFADSNNLFHGFLYDPPRRRTKPAGQPQFTVIDASFLVAPHPDEHLVADTLLGGINNRGQIVGESLFLSAPTAELSNETGFLYENEEFKPIPITRPVGINDRGEIVGVTPGAEVGLIYRKGVLTPVSFPGAFETTVLGINNKGDVVGTYQIAGEGIIHGFIYENRVFSTVDVPFDGVYATFPTSLNNKGQIVGVYFTIGEGEVDVVRSFLASPKKKAPAKK